jgi:hypothetical protein
MILALFNVISENLLTLSEIYIEFCKTVIKFILDFTLFLSEFGVYFLPTYRIMPSNAELGLD